MRNGILRGTNDKWNELNPSEPDSPLPAFPWISWEDCPQPSPELHAQAPALIL